MEHVKPLKDVLDWLAGKPDEIAAHAATWRNVAASATEAHQRYAAAVRMQTADWYGASGDAYRTHAGEQLAAVDGIATVTSALSYAVEGAGLLVGLVREIVRDLIAQFVATLAARLPQWLAEAGVTLGLATPVVAAQVATLVAEWVNRIQHFIRALFSSLRRLNGRLGELAGILDRLKQLLARLSRSEPATSAAPGGVSLYSRSGALSNREVLEQNVGLPRTADTVQRYADMAGVDFGECRSKSSRAPMTSPTWISRVLSPGLTRSASSWVLRRSRMRRHWCGLSVMRVCMSVSTRMAGSRP